MAENLAQRVFSRDGAKRLREIDNWILQGLGGLLDAGYRLYDNHPTTAKGWGGLLGNMASSVPGAIENEINEAAQDAMMQVGGASDGSKGTNLALGLLGGGGAAGVLPKMSVPQGSLRMINWHGGPNKWSPEPGFPQGRPRLDKIGTGEGAQAYGHGFYSAEAKGVAEDYAAKLGSGQTWLKHEGVMTPNGNVDPIDFAIEVLTRDAPQAGKKSAEDVVRKTLGALSNRQLQDVLQGHVLPLAREGLPRERWGDYALPYNETLYKLDIPDEDIAKYLDWDAPLSEQPGVLAALRRHWDETLGDPDIIQERLGITEKSTGQEIYNALQGVRQGGSDAQKAASEALRKAGIPGLKYYDGMSRGKGEGTRNFVTWDQDVLDRTKVLERNGMGLLEAVSQ